MMRSPLFQLKSMILDTSLSFESAEIEKFAIKLKAAAKDMLTARLIQSDLVEQEKRLTQIQASIVLAVNSTTATITK